MVEARLETEGNVLKVLVDDRVYAAFQYRSLFSESLRNRVRRELRRLIALGILPEDFNVDRFVVEEFSRLYAEALSSHERRFANPVDEILLAQAREIVKRRDLLNWVVDYYARHIKGKHERANIAIVFLCFLSARTSSPFSVIVKGSSSGGKTHLVRTISKAFTERVDYVVPVIVSPAVIKYIKGANTLVLYELPRNIGEQNILALRAVGDRMKIVGFVTMRDEAGRLYVEEVESDFRNFITTTTAVQIDEELENRLLAINVDESPRTTLEVIQHSLSSSDDESYFDLLRAVVSLIRPCTVVRPVYRLAIPDNLNVSRLPLRFRRDVKLILSVADAVSCLYQYQRVCGELDGTLYVFQQWEDLIIAYNLVRKYIYQAAVRLEGRLQKIYDFLREKYGMDESFTVEDVARLTGLSRRTVRDYLNALVDRGLLNSFTDELDRRRKRYVLADGGPSVPTIFDYITVDVDATRERLKSYVDLGIITDDDVDEWFWRFGECYENFDLNDYIKL